MQTLYASGVDLPTPQRCRKPEAGVELGWCEDEGQASWFLSARARLQSCRLCTHTCLRTTVVLPAILAALRLQLCWVCQPLLKCNSTAEVHYPLSLQSSEGAGCGKGCMHAARVLQAKSVL